MEDLDLKNSLDFFFPFWILGINKESMHDARKLVCFDVLIVKWKNFQTMDSIKQLKGREFFLLSQAWVVSERNFWGIWFTELTVYLNFLIFYLRKHQT